MAGTRRILLAIVGVLSGAWLGIEYLGRGLKKAARETVSPPQGPVLADAKARSPILAGAKGGAVALPRRDTPRAAPRREPSGPLPRGGKPVSAPGAQEAHNDISQIHGPIGYIKELFKRFNADHCPAWAAALSFFSLLSIPPVLLCGLAILGVLINDPQTAADRVREVIQNLLPGRGAQASAQSIIDQLQVEKHAATLMQTRGWAGLFGVLSLFWAASRIFVNASTPMNAAFGTEETRGFVKMQVYAFGLLLGAGALFLLSLIPASGPGLLRRVPFLSGLPDPSPWWLDVIFFVLGVAISAAMYTVIYRFLPSPSAGIQWRDAAFAGSIIAVLWEAAKQGFALYLRNFGSDPNEDKVYGALGGLIILVLWIYYSSMILLLGAEIAKLYSEAREAREGRA